MSPLSILGLVLMVTGMAGMWQARRRGAASRTPRPRVESAESGQQRLIETLDLIEQSYEGAVPPTLQSMRTLAISGRYSQMQAEMRRRWQDVVDFHQHRAMYVHTQTVIGFRDIRRLLPALIRFEDR